MNLEQYLLTVLAEEGGEVSKACAKAIRFRMDKYEPGGDGDNNRRQLEREVAQLLAVAEMLGLDVRQRDKNEKRDRVTHYLDVSRKLGVLEPEGGGR